MYNKNINTYRGFNIKSKNNISLNYYNLLSIDVYTGTCVILEVLHMLTMSIIQNNVKQLRF